MDFFQSTDILLQGKTENGWIVEGFLYDERAKITDDIYTIALKDVNTAYLILHRRGDSIMLGRFSMYNRSMDGASLKYTYGSSTIKVGAGKTRGTPGIFETIISPPYNIPIKITLKNLDFFVIVEHSERVFINGEILSEESYSVDYSRNTITLNIQSDLPQLNLRVEFEYHTPYESPYMYGIEYSYQTPVFRSSIKYLSENSKSKELYDQSGGIYMPKGGGDYEKRDSIFVYVGEGKGHYKVLFQIDTINGSYNYDERGFYTFVGKGIGRYSPINFENLSPLREIREINLQVGKKVFAGFNMISSINKTTQEKGRGGKFYTGIKTEHIYMNIGLWKTSGNAQYINCIFDPTKFTYTDTVKNEKFAHLKINYDKWNGTLYLAHDTMPSWYMRANISNLHLQVRGSSKPNEILIKYSLPTLSFGIFKTSTNSTGISGLSQTPNGTSFTGTLLCDSTKSLHYIMGVEHLIKYPHNRIKIKFTKTDALFLYSLISSLNTQNAKFTGEIKRSLDYNVLYLERYVKTGEGNFTYDSSFSQMVPSEFGEYMRIITTEPGKNITYKYTYALSGLLQNKSWSVNFIISSESMDNNSTRRFSTRVKHNVFMGSDLSLTYRVQNYLTLDNASSTGYQRELRISTLDKAHITPFFISSAFNDVFSNIEEYSIGGGVIYTAHKNIRVKAEVSKNRHSLIFERYYKLNALAEFNTQKTNITLMATYSTTNSSIIEDAKYFGLSIKHPFKIGTINNILKAYLIAPNYKKMKWGISTTLKF